MENNWVKVQSFARLHQAELVKDILTQNEIYAVIVNEKDSLFLTGEIELYVENTNEKKAKALIDEFKGLTKINSFIQMKPVLMLQKILQEAGIPTQLKRTRSDKYTADNYELYVENELLEKTVPYLTGEKLKDRQHLITCKKVRQASYYVDLLSQELIDTLVIKKKDSDFHMEELNIYVKKEDHSKAKKVIEELTGFTLLKKTDQLQMAQRYDAQLYKENIKAILQKKDTAFCIYVESDKLSHAKEVIEKNRCWKTLQTLSNVATANYYAEILEETGIPAIILNEKDSSFMLGEIDLLVDQDYFDQAKELINKIS